MSSAAVVIGAIRVNLLLKCDLNRHSTMLLDYSLEENKRKIESLLVRVNISRLRMARQRCVYLKRGKANIFKLHSNLLTTYWRRIGVSALSSRRIDVFATSFLGHVLAGNMTVLRSNLTLISLP